MEAIRFSEIAAVTGASPAGEGAVTSVVTDSRRILPGCLFVAIRGARFDGHDFIGEAFLRGAAAVLSERPAIGGPVFVVKDTVRAMQALAAAYRSRFPDLRVAAVTGSVGKTTTKEMLAGILGERMSTLKTQGNFNNELGLPLTVFHLEPSHEAAVFEMGMSGFGEIARLTAIARPQVAIISNIGVAHIEMMGSRENILKAKLEVAQGLPRDGTLILNADEPLLWELRGRLPHRLVYFGIDNPEADFLAENIQSGEGGSSFEAAYRGQRVPVRLEVAGEHNIKNALCAFAAADCFGVTGEEAARGLSQFKSHAGRQHVYERDGLVIIDDSYNASPDSMEAALKVLSSMKGGRRAAVLSDMLELGAYSQEAHERVGAAAADAGIDRLFVFGSNARYYVAAAIKAGMPPENALHFPDRPTLACGLTKWAKPGDVILFKGSRAMKTEEVIKQFFEERDGAWTER